jgi:hypothetical protein
MELLTEEICFVRKKDFGTFDFSQVKSLSLGFIRSRHDRIAERCHMVPEFLRIVDDLVENLFFVRLERKRGDFILPLLEILQLRSRGVTRDSYSPVTDGASVLLLILDFTSSDLETFPMVPTLC